MSGRGRLLLVVATLVLGVTAIAVVVVRHVQQSRACTYGFYGSDLQVTVEGSNDTAYCERLANPHICQLRPASPACDDPPPIPTTATEGNVGGYVVNQPDTESTIMCSYTVPTTGRAGPAFAGVTITVRDKGLVKAYGTEYCQELSSWDGLTG